MGPHIGSEKAPGPHEGFIPDQKLKLIEQVSEVMAKPGLGVRRPPDKSRNAVAGESV